MKSLLTKYIGAFTGLVVFAVYLQTMSPGLNGGDCGELAAVQTTLGIAHPTGYPLFTILGYIFTKIPFDIEPIQKLNLLAVLFTAFGMSVFYAAQVKFLFTLRVPNQLIINNFKIYLIAIFSTLLLAFSPTIWFQSTFTEVYSLHILIISSLLYLMISIIARQGDGKKTKRLWIFVGVLLGLGFSNHLTTIFILPGFIYLYIQDKTIESKKPLFVFVSIVVAVTSLVLYSYILIRSNMNPQLNWGKPNSFARLLDHITASDYRSWMFPGIDLTISQFGQLVISLFGINNWEFNFSIIFLLVGVIVLIKIHKLSFTVFSITLFTSIFLSINYFIPDINNYFIIIFILSAVFISTSLLFLFSTIKNYLAIGLINLLMIVSLVLQVAGNFETLDKSKDYIYDEYARAVLLSVDKNGIIIVNRNAPFYFQSIYLQKVEKLRTDAAIVCIDFQESWYFEMMNREYPDVIDIENKKFIIDVSKRPVYVYSQLLGEFDFSPQFELVPLSLLFKVNRKNEYLAESLNLFDFSKIKNSNNPEINSIIENIAVMYENRAKYELKYEKNDEAEKWIQTIEKYFPEFDLRISLDR